MHILYVSTEWTGPPLANAFNQSSDAASHCGSYPRWQENGQWISWCKFFALWRFHTTWTGTATSTEQHEINDIMPEVVSSAVVLDWKQLSDHTISGSSSSTIVGLPSFFSCFLFSFICCSKMRHQHGQLARLPFSRPGYTKPNQAGTHHVLHILSSCMDHINCTFLLFLIQE